MSELEITQSTEQASTVPQSNGATAGGQAANTLPPSDYAAKTGSAKKERAKTSAAFLETLQTPQGQTFTTGLLSVLVVALLFFFAITPAVSSITRQLEVNRDLRDRNSKYDQKLASLVSLSQKKQTYATDLETFSTMLGETPNQEYIYADMIQISQRNNLEFRGVTFDVLSPQQQKYELFDINEKLHFQTLTLNVYGNFNNLDDLVNDIETSKRIYDVQDIVVATDENQRTSVSANIVINTIYWRVEE